MISSTTSSFTSPVITVIVKDFQIPVQHNSGDIDQEQELMISEETSVETHDAPSDWVWAFHRRKIHQTTVVEDLVWRNCLTGLEEIRE